MLRTFPLLSICFLLFSLTSIRCQSKENNCNDIFRYVTDNGTGEQVGLLRVPQDGADVLELKVNMTVNGIVKSSGKFELKLLSNKRDFLSGKPLHYVVHFPKDFQAPRISGVDLNGRLLCFDDTPMQEDVPQTLIMTRSVVKLQRVPIDDNEHRIPPDTDDNPQQNSPPPTPPPQQIASNGYPPNVYPPNCPPPNCYPPPPYPPLTYPNYINQFPINNPYQQQIPYQHILAMLADVRQSLKNIEVCNCARNGENPPVNADPLQVAPQRFVEEGIHRSYNYYDGGPLNIPNVRLGPLPYAARMSSPESVSSQPIVKDAGTPIVGRPISNKYALGGAEQ